jgi:aminoglycoside phosphotransferase (APT) family kinase protein
MKDTARTNEYLATNMKLRAALEIPEGVNVEVHDLAQGEHNANLWFAHPASGNKMVLRINYISQFNLDDQIGYEYHMLEALSSTGCTPKPLFLDSSSDFFEHGALVMEFVEGESLSFDNPTHIEKAARILADVHCAVPPENDEVLLYPKDTLQNLFDECYGYFEKYRHASIAEERIIKRLERFVKYSERELHPRKIENPRAHFVSTEPVPSHFILSHTGHGGYLIDWDKALIGENTRDVAYFMAPTSTVWDSDFIFDKSDMDKFVNNYWDAVGSRFPVADFEERLSAYLKLNCLRGTTWSAMTWVEYQRPDLVLKNDKTIEKFEKYYLNDDFLDMLEENIFQ